MTDGNHVLEKRLFFGGIIIGIILGISGNIAVSSIFELVHILSLDKTQIYLELLVLTIIGSVFITAYVGYTSWKKICED